MILNFFLFFNNKILHLTIYLFSNKEIYYILSIFQFFLI